MLLLRTAFLHLALGALRPVGPRLCLRTSTGVVVGRGRRLRSLWPLSTARAIGFRPGAFGRLIFVGLLRLSCTLTVSSRLAVGWRLLLAALFGPLSAPFFGPLLTVRSRFSGGLGLLLSILFRALGAALFRPLLTVGLLRFARLSLPGWLRGLRLPGIRRCGFAGFACCLATTILAIFLASLLCFTLLGGAVALLALLSLFTLLTGLLALLLRLFALLLAILCLLASGIRIRRGFLRLPGGILISPLLRDRPLFRVSGLSAAGNRVP